MRHESLTECPIQLRTTRSDTETLIEQFSEHKHRGDWAEGELKEEERAYIRQAAGWQRVSALEVRAFLWAKKLLMETAYPSNNSEWSSQAS